MLVAQGEKGPVPICLVRPRTADKMEPTNAKKSEKKERVCTIAIGTRVFFSLISR